MSATPGSASLNIVIPVKEPTGAKSRLAALLTPAERRELALTLLGQVLAFFRDLAGDFVVTVVTDSDRVAARAAEFPVHVLREAGPGRGETAAVEFAARDSVRRGFASQLVIPGDMAELDRAELTRLLDEPRPHPSVILCPAVGDDGTNAILTTPPDAIAFRFGDKSFAGYRARAAAAGVPCTILRLPSLVLDLDTPEDVDTFLRTGARSPAAELLRGWRLPDRE